MLSRLNVVRLLSGSTKLKGVCRMTELTSYVGRSLLRRKDRRLLTGGGQFIADFELPRMLHAAFVRSPLAHARLRSLDLSRAAAAPGVALALGGAEVLRLLPP